jgi:hypothetical protein
VCRFASLYVELCGLHVESCSDAHAVLAVEGRATRCLRENSTIVNVTFQQYQ